MHPKNADGVVNRVLFRLVLNSPLTLLHSEWPKLWSFVHSECNRFKLFFSV